MSHVREARLLCRKTVDFFTLLSHTNESQREGRRAGMTQELLALVTGLAHYLKILIRIALTGALKLLHSYDNPHALNTFIHHLDVVVKDNANANSYRDNAVSSRMSTHWTHLVAYGYNSLARKSAGASPFASASGSEALLELSTVPPTDLCVACKSTVEDDCVRLGTYKRWHSQCVKCSVCGVDALAPSEGKSSSGGDGGDADDGSAGSLSTMKLSTKRRRPARADDFTYVLDDARSDVIGIYCKLHTPERCESGFDSVLRLEQYSFLLNVALRRLAILLMKRGVLSADSK